ncbi:FAD-dependent monooxygenase [Janthinobacterium lividum]|uniref:FAD-dependent monooxygenase n=1 Tax=Janthinobacterium lividum TaxID=29581 RepID=A0ABU0XMB3_9BURK|nr:FAD-dependent monooxygenase [Janthinobacterium lividum]MDQ4624665.1 FAD-dependent monooxygenase [Janthinobacterium lividum]MDQ4673731.1 FAD-dependent monooxygenase [Janthinobacterium lividum]MDQ4684461.1 FAD-dependent monooxygenase [Janthinobacterium lividum]
MTKKRKILVTGASVAGPTLAYWLSRLGMDVTVVERAPEFRDGGQTIDVRGAGKLVAQRMGLESAIRAKSTHEDGIRFVDAQDRTQAEFGIGAFGGNGPVAELEILRGELARLLIGHGRDAVDYRFGDSIAALEELPHGVKVRFEQGGEEMFDLVIGAEGVGSHTRKLVFGDEVQRRSFKLYTAYFTIPRAPGDERQMRWFNAPGGLSVCLRPDNLGTTRALLSFQEAPSAYEKLPIVEQKALLKEKFGALKWETPRILAALDDATDLYFDQISQVRMPRWSKGRIALVGDAAYCASPISGMGTSLGMCGAYVLAGELGRHDDHTQAFAAYETIMRPYVDQAQDVPTFAPRLASPHSRAGIAVGHAMLRMSNVPILKTILARFLTPKADAIALPEYANMA